MMGFSPYRSLPLSYSKNFAYAYLYVYLQQLQSRLYFIGSGMFSSWNSCKTGWRKIRRGSGMSWRQLAWPPDVNACQTQLQHSTAASRASFVKYLLALHSGMGYIRLPVVVTETVAAKVTCHHFAVRVTYSIITLQLRTQRDWSCDKQPTVTTISLICNQKTNFANLWCIFERSRTLTVQ
jgi:hypothetical protein